MSDQNNTSMSPLTGMGFGGIFFLAGAFIVLIAADIIHVDPSSIHAPRWVLGAAGLVFMLAGTMVALQGAFGPNPEESLLYLWLILFIGTAFMLIFSSVFIWVGFGPGERAFSSSVSIGFVSSSGKGSETTGRLIFGGGGLIGLLITFFMARANWKKIRNFDG